MATSKPRSPSRATTVAPTSGAKNTADDGKLPRKYYKLGISQVSATVAILLILINYKQFRRRTVKAPTACDETPSESQHAGVVDHGLFQVTARACVAENLVNIPSRGCFMQGAQPLSELGIITPGSPFMGRQATNSGFTWLWG